MSVNNFWTQKQPFFYHTESVNGIVTFFFLNGSRTRFASMVDNLTDIRTLWKPPTTTIPNKHDCRGLVKKFSKVRKCTHHYHQQWYYSTDKCHHQSLHNHLSCSILALCFQHLILCTCCKLIWYSAMPLFFPKERINRIFFLSVCLLW